ncbi:MAG TPA: hypothetical protein VFV66_10085 [Nonomuraea sp.]|nr:hypothetical protein [Nonomuraea sp.]
MNDTGKVALAIVAGYYLGRRHKLRMASAVAATMVARRLRRGDGGAVQQARKLLSASPEVGEMTDRLRGELLELTKSAAMTAAARQIEALADRMRQGQLGAEETAEGTAEETTERGERAEGEEREERAGMPKPRVPKQRMPKPPTRKAADSLSATTGAGRRRASDADESRE